MYRILEELGYLPGSSVKIFKLEDIGFVAVNYMGADGTNMDAWRCDEAGYTLDKEEPCMTFAHVWEQNPEDPDDWELIGFEEC